MFAHGSLKFISEKTQIKREASNIAVPVVCNLTSAYVGIIQLQKTF